MFSEWKEVCLDELVDIKHGFAFKGEYFQSEPRPDVIITPGNFAIGGGYQEKKLKYYEGPVPEGYVLQGGELVVTMTDLSKSGDTLGYSAIIPHDLKYRLLHNQRIGLVQRKDEQRTSLDFLHWLLRSKAYRNNVLATATGSTVRHTSPSRIGAFRFRLPPLDEQCRIAAVLSALDDKIELNRKMNQTLEEMTQAIFKSWFIDFDGVPEEDLVDSELGPRPKGWGIGSIENFVAFENGDRGKNYPKQSEYVDSGIPFISGRDIAGGFVDIDSANKVPPSVYQRINRGRVRTGDLLYSLRGTLGRIARVQAGISGIIASSLVIMRGKQDHDTSYLYCMLSGGFGATVVRELNNGSAQPNISVRALSKYPCLVPPLQILRHFKSVHDPIWTQLEGNLLQSRSLAELRDVLLPKLISGELRVPEAEEAVEEAV